MAEPEGQDEIILSLNVDKHVYIISLQDLSLGAISSTSPTSASGVMHIRSNRAPWSVGVYAEKGALAEWDPATLSYIAGGEMIPYTFSFNTDSLIPEERIVAQAVPTVSANALTATFNRKTLYGANGEPFGYSVQVSAEAGSAAWAAGYYHDLLHVTLTAY